VVLCDIEGFSYEEIAATLGVKLGTVRSRIHRGRAQLRTALEHRRPATAESATVDAAKNEAAKNEAATVDAAKNDAPSSDAPSSDAPGSEAASGGPDAEAKSAWGQGLRRPGLVPRLKRSGGS
jgi:RNA polymerase sigma-70 factor (ECF subfamily)